MNATRTLTVRVATLVAAAGLLLSGCGSTAPNALVRRDVAPAATSDVSKPCTREAAATGAPAAESAPAGLAATFDAAGDKIVLSGGQNVTLPALSAKLNKPDLLKETAPGEWLLGKTIEINQGASLKIAAPTVRWLKLRSDDAGKYTSVRALGGGIDISGTCITSWNEAKGTVDEDYLNGRGFILARDGAQMTIDKAELQYLGFGDVESYGLVVADRGQRRAHHEQPDRAPVLRALQLRRRRPDDQRQRGPRQRAVRHRPAHRLAQPDDRAQRRPRQRQARHHPRRRLHRQRDPRQRRLPQPAPRDRALPALRPEPDRGQRDVRQRRAGHQHQRGVEQHDQVEPGLRQHRVRHRHRPDRQGQRRAGQRRPRQPAGRAAAGQRGQPRPTCATT